METTDEIINKVTGSSLVTIDLESIYPQGERVIYDLKDNLYQGLILKEKDFRDFLRTHDWTVYTGKNIAITCSEDVIVPTWAYMLLAIKMQPHASLTVFGTLQDLENMLWQQAIGRLNISAYRDAKIVIKGCSHLPVPVFAYTELSRLLTPVAASIMYGEPCSTVPLFKRKSV